jgi:hypothetical protein
MVIYTIIPIARDVASIKFALIKNGPAKWPADAHGPGGGYSKGWSKPGRVVPEAKAVEKFFGGNKDCKVLLPQSGIIFWILEENLKKLLY